MATPTSREDVRVVSISTGVDVGGQERLLLMAGPCQIESAEHSLKIAAFLQALCANYPVNFVFKASFDKANRTSLKGVRGPGMERGLRILERVKQETGCLTMTDIHTPQQASAAAQAVDVLQIPAFLCRQTDLLIAAGATGKPLNIKKGQFLHPADMRHVIEKVESSGNRKIMLCERGACFGYRDLIVDMRSLLIMRKTGYPVVFDGTHAVQVMGGEGGASSGQREYVAPLACAAAAVGIDGLFLECHEDPEHAPSDGASMLPLVAMQPLLERVCRIRRALEAA